MSEPAPQDRAEDGPHSFTHSHPPLAIGGQQLIINPGSGPCEDATEENAIANIKRLIVDCATDGINWVRVSDEMEYDGRFGFRLQKGDVEFIVDMPGLPLAQVRWMDGEDQNIWNFPRLYVDGSSWVWKFALSILRDRFSLQENNDD